MPTISTNPYKGTRDFYPEDMIRRNYIFDTWRYVLVQNGFVEYDSSVVENAEIYLAKSGEELGSKQLYSFIDKGDRKIALRPEMTPTLARIVAAKFGEVRFPLRWFSIPNCFRYERPQKGRLREFWQLNVDIIGKEAGEVDIELLVVTAKMFLAFGADKSMFKIMFNHRQVLDKWLESNNLLDNKTIIYAVLDDWFKVTIEENKSKLNSELNEVEIQKLINLCSKTDSEWNEYLTIAKTFPDIKMALEILPKILSEVEFDFNPTIIRGLAYYTGLVMEGFNKNPISPRAMFGAGRYDDLLDLFGQKAPAVGVGIGDVTWADFLNDWNLWPDFGMNQNRVGILLLNSENLPKVYDEIIPGLNTKNIPFEIDYEYSRSENKRYESLKKRGCSEIIKV
jgi:histidyl-tRNA synthetase